MGTSRAAVLASGKPRNKTNARVEDATTLDLATPKQYNGRCLHATEPFEGWRVSIIWFSNSREGFASEATMDEVRQYGCEATPKERRRDDTTESEQAYALAVRPTRELMELGTVTLPVAALLPRVSGVISAIDLVSTGTPKQPRHACT